MAAANQRQPVLSFLKLVQQYCASPSPEGYHAVLAAAQTLALREKPHDHDVSQFETNDEELSHFAQAHRDSALP